VNLTKILFNIWGRKRLIWGQVQTHTIWGILHTILRVKLILEQKLFLYKINLDLKNKS